MSLGQGLAFPSRHLVTTLDPVRQYWFSSPNSVCPCPSTSTLIISIIYIEMSRSYPLSPLFIQKKTTILSALSAPSESYTDLSPKGSIDAGIRDLIDRINKLEGVVTTSSCAGRISCFLEGAKPGSSDNQNGDSAGISGGDGMVVAYDESVEVGDLGDKLAEERSERPSTVPGGKGNGGRWLFVSHDPVDIPPRQFEGDIPISRLFNISPSRDSQSQLSPSSRFVKFQFEPMVSPAIQNPTISQLPIYLS